MARTYADMLLEDLRSPLFRSLGASPPPWLTLDFFIAAKRYTLDPDGFIYVDQMASDHRDLIDELDEFAIPPFERIMIESPAPPDMSAAVIAALDPPLAHLWMQSRDQVSHWAAMRNGTWTETITSGPEVGAAATERIHYFLKAFYLILHSRRAVVISEVPRRRAISRGRSVVYQAHTKITIDLSAPRITRRSFGTGTHASPRRHEVAGHFVHRGGDQYCTHTWMPRTLEPPDDIPRWECAACGRRRTWRKAFERGDAGKGWVRQSYEITAAERQANDT